MMGGACCADRSSFSVRLRRFTIKTLSWASTHTPPTCPVVQLFGKGFGQEASTSNLGAAPCARASGAQKTAHAQTARTRAVFATWLFMFPPLSPFDDRLLVTPGSGTNAAQSRT